MRQLAVMLAAMLVTGCTSFPQSRDSFLQDSADGEGKMVEMVVARPLSSVMRSLQWGVKECLNQRVDREVLDDDERVRVSNRYRAALISKRDGYAEITVQMAQEPAVLGGSMPDGGYYIAAANLRALSSKRTKVSLFGAPVGEGPAIAGAMEQWVRGGAAACPPLK